MTRREQLLEACEDAYFALLMEEVAQSEGADWERRRQALENDGDAAVPEGADRRCVQAIDRHFAVQRWRRRLRTVRKAINCMAVVLGAGSLLLTSALAFSEDARITASNLLITVSERYTQFQMRPPESQGTEETRLPDDYFQDIHIGWLPAGFSRTGGEPDLFAEFENADGLYLAVACSADSHILQIDTKDVGKTEDFVINGCNVLAIYKNGAAHFVLTNLEKQRFVEVLVSEGIAPEIGVRILENITFS